MPSDGRKCKNIAETKRAKGVPKATVDKDMKFESYEDVLKKGSLATREVTNLGSFHQQLFTLVTKQKIVLNGFYDKMKMLNQIDCEPYGFLEEE